MVKVIIVSRVRLYGEGLADYLSQDQHLQVVGVAVQIEPAIDLIKSKIPDIVLYDLVQLSALAGVQRLLSRCPGINIVALGIQESESAILACAEVGVGGYVAGEATLSDLKASIFAAALGELNCSPRIAHRLLREVGRLTGSQRTPEFDADRLTARELDILQLIERGLSNLEIAEQLGIVPSTVKNHVHHILEKLNVKRRGEAAAVSRRGGDWAIREIAK